MRLGGRLAAAAEVLAEVGQGRRPVSEALKAWGLAHRFAGAGDRAAIGNLVYDALRQRSSHAWAMGSDAPRALVLSVVVRGWGLSPDVLAAALEGDPHAPPPPDDEERSRLLAMDPLAGAPDHIRADLPEWAAPGLAELFGPDWVAEGEAMAGRPPLDLRVNTLKSMPDKVLKGLARFAAVPGPATGAGVRIAAGTGDSRTPNVEVEEGYQKGWFEVQDQGSQLAALLSGAKPGELVLDFCAGAGGKTLAMAAAMGNRGQIFAHDADRTRLAPIYARLKRAGVRNAQVRAPAPGALDDLRGKMDRVVVDAPCTGSGTWRRQPAAKWKLSPDQLAARVAEQRAILDEATRFVRPGGVLVYITCSILPAENERQIEALLDRHPGFSPQAPDSLWYAAAAGKPIRANFQRAGLMMTPRLTGTDGFYVAVLTRS